MAISSSFFNLRRGSTKSLTFQIYRGKQVTKDRVQKVANPQSDAQMLQRIKLAGIMQTRSTLKPILNHAFEGVEYGEKSLEEFIRLNLQNKNNLVDFVSYGTSKTPGTSVASYQISKGTLLPVSYEMQESFLFATAATDDYSLPSPLPTLKTSLVDELYKVLNLSDDAQISIIYAIRTGQSFTLTVNGTTKTLPILKWRVARIKKDDDSIMKAWAWCSDSGEDNSTISDGQTRVAITTNANGPIQVYSGSSDKATNLNMMMGAIVISEPDGDNWKRSTQYLATWASAEENLTADEAIWLLTSESAATKYLNAGGSGSIEMVPMPDVQV